MNNTIPTMCCVMLITIGVVACSSAPIRRDSTTATQAQRELKSAITGKRSAAQVAEDYERILKNVDQHDTQFREVLLTGLGLMYMQMGNRQDLLSTVKRLDKIVDVEATMSPETQYVLDVAAVLSGQSKQPLNGHGQDQELYQAIVGLLKPQLATAEGN